MECIKWKYNILENVNMWYWKKLNKKFVCKKWKHPQETIVYFKVLLMSLKKENSVRSEKVVLKDFACITHSNALNQYFTETMSISIKWKHKVIYSVLYIFHQVLRGDCEFWTTNFVRVKKAEAKECWIACFMRSIFISVNTALFLNNKS